MELLGRRAGKNIFQVANRERKHPREGRGICDDVSCGRWLFRGREGAAVQELLWRNSTGQEPGAKDRHARGLSDVLSATLLVCFFENEIWVISLK